MRMRSSAQEKATIREEAKRDQIRAAAQGLFLERGFGGASTDAIAKGAGVSKETLYRYFPSKEDLLADVLRHLIAHVSRDGSAAGIGGAIIEDRGDLREALLGLAGRFIDDLMRPEYLALVRVIITETPRLPQLGHLFRSTVPENALRSVGDLLRRARDKGLTRSADPEAAARLFVGPLLTYVLLDGLLEGQGPPKKPPSDRIEAVVDLYMQAIARA